MNPWEQFLEVQRLDTELDQLAHRRAAIPELEELAQLPAEYERIDAAVAELEVKRKELAKQQQGLEDEVSSLGARRDQATAKLYDGSTVVPKELKAIQDDIASIERRISTLDDQTLELMEVLEPITTGLAALSAEWNGVDERAADLEKRVAESQKVIDAEISVVTDQRASATADIRPDLVEQYDKARKHFGGVAVARLNHGVCDGCHLTLSAVEIDRIKHVPVDEPVTCEDCGRFLVR